MSSRNMRTLGAIAAAALVMMVGASGCEAVLGLGDLKDRVAGDGGDDATTHDGAVADGNARDVRTTPDTGSDAADGSVIDSGADSADVGNAVDAADAAPDACPSPAPPCILDDPTWAGRLDCCVLGP